nr:hypothetical protein [uncultured Prevotella sp.]
MTRKEAAELLPVIQAFSEGRIIEFSSITDVSKAWREVTEFPVGMIKYFKFRIKPESKYRPFKNAEECLAEMQKHQLFGWVKNQGLYRNIANVMSYSITFADNEARDVNYEQAFKNYTFTDGTPFGIKEEE